MATKREKRTEIYNEVIGNQTVKIQNFVDTKYGDEYPGVDSLAHNVNRWIGDMSNEPGFRILRIGDVVVYNSGFRDNRIYCFQTVVYEVDVENNP